MVGEILGKGCVFVFVLITVSVTLEHNTPYSSFESRLGNPLVSRPTCYKVISWVVSKSVLPSPWSYHSYVQEKFIQTYCWVGHMQLSILTVLAFPMSISTYVHTLFHLQNLLLISFHWWGIHQGPPLMSLFPLTPTHYPGIRLRNHLVP